MFGKPALMPDPKITDSFFFLFPSGDSNNKLLLAAAELFFTRKPEIDRSHGSIKWNRQLVVSKNMKRGFGAIFAWKKFESN